MSGGEMRAGCEWRGLYRFQIREVATGRTVVCEFDSPHASRSDFWWLEGGYSCDCNRKLQFDRALDQVGDVASGSDYPCGEGVFVFDWVELDGVRFIENDKPTEHAR